MLDRPGGIDFTKGVSGALLEHKYHSLSLPHRLRAHRFGLAIAACVAFAIGVVDTYRVLATLRESACAPLCLTSARLPLVLSEFGASACCVLALAALHARLARTLVGGVLVLGYVAVGVSLTVASAALDSAFAVRMSTSVMIVFYALVGNISGLQFAHVVLVCVITLVVYALRALAALGALGSSHRSLWHSIVPWDDAHGPRPPLPVGGDFSAVDWAFWAGFAIVGALSATYSQESYARRRFVLVERLTDETERTDTFLYRMLPPPVVAQMKRGFHVADEFDDVFILASDICGFTKLSAASQPSEVMQLLSTLFSRFDEISEEIGVYKVQTIGDAYIAVTGIFSRTSGDDEGEEGLMMTSEVRKRRRTQNARAIVEFATAMLQTIKTVPVPAAAEASGQVIDMRIGVHVGHLTAGVIGTKRLRYDIWGPAFLAATALESSGVPGEVCVSEEVLRHLDGAYAHAKHEVVPLKARLRDGSDQLQSYRLLGRKPAAPAPAAPTAPAAPAAPAPAPTAAPAPNATADVADAADAAVAASSPQAGSTPTDTSCTSSSH